MFDEVAQVETLHELEFLMIATALSDVYRTLIGAASAGQLDEALIAEVEAKALRTIEESRKVFGGSLPGYFETALQAALFELRTFFASCAAERATKH